MDIFRQEPSAARGWAQRWVEALPKVISSNLLGSSHGWGTVMQPISIYTIFYWLKGDVCLSHRNLWLKPNRILLGNSWWPMSSLIWQTDICCLALTFMFTSWQDLLLHLWRKPYFFFLSLSPWYMVADNGLESSWWDTVYCGSDKHNGIHLHSYLQNQFKMVETYIWVL